MFLPELYRFLMYHSIGLFSFLYFINFKFHCQIQLHFILFNVLNTHRGIVIYSFVLLFSSTGDIIYVFENV